MSAQRQSEFTVAVRARLRVAVVVAPVCSLCVLVLMAARKGQT